MVLADGRHIEPAVFSPPVEQLAGIGQREQEQSQQQKDQKKSKSQQDKIVQTLRQEQQRRQEKTADGHIDYHA